MNTSQIDDYTNARVAAGLLNYIDGNKIRIKREEKSRLARSFLAYLKCYEEAVPERVRRELHYFGNDRGLAERIVSEPK